MFGTQLLDVAIGLALTYTTLSLLTSAGVEMLESALRTRAKYLWQGIAELVQDRPRFPNFGWLMRLIGDTRRGGQSPARAATVITLADVYKHPLIGGLYYGDYDKAAGPMLSRRLPSYIPRTAFATAIIDLVSRQSPASDVSTIERFRRGVGQLAGTSLGQALGALVAVSGDDLSAVQRSVEGWYDSAMDRVSGWYKRHAQLLLLVLGFVVAFSINADSIALVRHLMTDEPAREALVEAAGEFVAAHRDTTLPATIKDIQTYVKEIESKAGPIGNRPAELPPLAFVGYLLTALAISFGAPFWFDLLNKIMVIRSTVKPKEKSGDEGSEDRPAGSSARAAGTPTSFVMRP